MHLSYNFTYSIVGHGRVGAALNAALDSIGGLCTGIFYTRRVRQTNSDIDTELALNSISDLKPSDLVFICVPDDAIESVSKQIPIEVLNRKGSIVTHVSGSKPSLILDHLSTQSILVASSHPLMTFKIQSDSSIFKGVTVSLEGDNQAVLVLEELFIKLGSNPLRVTPEQKKLLHLAAVITSNFMSSLAFYAAEVLKPLDADPLDMVGKVFGPLMQKTAENITKDGFPSALTGPASRGDVSTIQEHLAIIKTLGIEEETYRELTHKILQYSHHKEG